MTSSDDTDEGIVLGLERLLDCQVESIQVLPPAWDLTVQFSKGYCLRVFCDHVPGDPSFDGNWELWLRQVSLRVGPGERRALESRLDEQVGSAAAGQVHDGRRAQ